MDRRMSPRRLTTAPLNCESARSRPITVVARSATRLYQQLAPHTGDRGIAGFHLYTFNDLESTWRWTKERRAGDALQNEMTPAHAAG